MKNTVLLLSLMLCSFCNAYAQGLIVSYEETISIRLPSNFSNIDNPQVRAAIESSMRERSMEQTKSATLLVNNGTSVYKTGTAEQAKREENMEIEGDMGGNLSMQTNMSMVTSHLIYKNHLDGVMLSQASIDGKEYLIEEPLTEMKWKIGRKKRNISGYECIEATAKTANGTPITAWYTPDIPISDGPASYSGLPGLILYVDQNNGMRVFSCMSIEQDNNSLSIEAPDTGEKVSREQYRKVVTELSQRITDAPSTTTERRGNTTTTTRRGATTVR